MRLLFALFVYAACIIAATSCGSSRNAVQPSVACEDGRRCTMVCDTGWVEIDGKPFPVYVRCEAVPCEDDD